MWLRGERSKRNRWLAVALAFSAVWAAGQDPAADAWRLERGGDADQALRRLRQGATAAPIDTAAMRAYAEFLERHHDPAAREAYGQLAEALRATNAAPEQRAAVAHRLAVLELLAGDRQAASRHLQDYAAAGGKDLTLAAARAAAPPSFI